MRAWLALTGAELVAAGTDGVVARLSAESSRRGLGGGAAQDAAWRAEIAALIRAVRDADGAAWTVALEYDLIRLGRRADAIILTDRAIICAEFKTAPPSPALMREAEDYALDLRDFHAGSRAHPIVPILVSDNAPWIEPPPALPLDAVRPVLLCGHATLADAMRHVAATTPAGRSLNGRAWLDAPYRPVPGIVEAARRIFDRHDVVEIGLARADAANLGATRAAVARALDAARGEGRREVVFVTGIPGAGKTLCGLDAVFRREEGTAAFLTGNAPLVAVLREALARDARARGRDARATRHAVEGFVQNVHVFLDDNHARPAAPPERVIVFDEAQRAWDEDKARRGTFRKPSKLTASEPAHALEIMARHDGWACIVALIGNGQEINVGEAGLAEWGRAITASRGTDRPWTARAAPRALNAEDPRQRLATGEPSWLTVDDALDLRASLRAVRDGAVADWVGAVLDGDAPRAAALAGPDFPVFLTRDLHAARAALRAFARGARRSGLVRSSGAKRLRAEGLDAEVAVDAVADWFLRRFPDIRASDALEAAATEYACQGLELDVVGIAWDLDFRRGREGWTAHALAGAGWRSDAAHADYVRNTYRVLLTRARAETVIWVPAGSDSRDPFHDPTRPAPLYDAIAAFLSACGARPLPPLPAALPVAEATLL